MSHLGSGSLQLVLHRITTNWLPPPNFWCRVLQQWLGGIQVETVQ
jgi:hypothetical protein